MHRRYVVFLPRRRNSRRHYEEGSAKSGKTNDIGPAEDLWASLADAKLRENPAEQVVARHCTGDLAERLVG